MRCDLDAVIAHAQRTTGRSFASRDVVVGERYGFWVVRLAADLMAYVAKDDAAWSNLARQRRVLTRVAQRVSFRLPRPIGRDEAPVDLRERVPGVTGSRFHERLTNDAALRASVAAWMGDVLAELHGALANVELDTLGVDDPVWPHRLDRLLHGIDTHLEGEAREAAHAVARAWHERVRHTRNDVFLHGDFGAHNLAFDEETGLPLGVFDFHDAGRGPRAVDLKLLPSYGDDALGIAMTRYEEKSGVALPVAEIRLAHAVTALAYLAWRADDAEAHDRGSGRDRSAAVAWAIDAVKRAQ